MDSELHKLQARWMIREYLVREYKHWTWSIRPMHSTLGASILAINRDAPHFSDLTGEEAAELSIATKDIEAGLKRAFGFERINYLMLMMHDPIAHFHVIPRYSTDKYFAGAIWTDAGWKGDPPMPVLAAQNTLEGQKGTNPELLKSILEEVKRSVE